MPVVIGGIIAPGMGVIVPVEDAAGMPGLIIGAGGGIAGTGADAVGLLLLEEPPQPLKEHRIPTASASEKRCIA